MLLSMERSTCPDKWIPETNDPWSDYGMPGLSLRDWNFSLLPARDKTFHLHPLLPFFKNRSASYSEFHTQSPIQLTSESIRIEHNPTRWVHIYRILFACRKGHPWKLRIYMNLGSSLFGPELLNGGS